MSKRAQSAERKYYGALYSDQMKNERKGFIKGYEQAEKDTIERVVKWLKENWREYVWTTDNGVPHFGHWENDFCKAMEEE